MFASWFLSLQRRGTIRAVAVIPRIIHQIWIGPHPRPTHFMETWQRMNPSFSYELWDDERCAAFGFRNAAKIAEQPEWAGKADLIRYEILHKYGGIFVDADSECLRALPEDILNCDSFACWESEIARPGLISNSCLGACTANRLMNLLVFTAGMLDMAAGDAWMTTGPLLLTSVVSLHSYNKLVVHPSHYFIPEHYSGAVHSSSGPTYARQHWLSTKMTYEARRQNAGVHSNG